MKCNIEFFVCKLNYYFQKKNSLLIFLLILVGVILPTVSGSVGISFFEKLYRIITNQFFNMFFILACGLGIIYIKNEYTKSYNFISRTKDYKQLIKDFIKDIVLVTSFLYCIAIVLSVAGACIFCFGNYEFVTHPTYDFNIIFYLVFFLIRSIVISSIINIIIYLFSCIFKNKISLFLILFSSVIFTNLVPAKVVYHFYDMNILYHYYFLSVEYSSFWVEIICSSLEILLLLMLGNFIYKIIISKKRDLV